jgi:hypothetical protein
MYANIFEDILLLGGGEGVNVGRYRELCATVLPYAITVKILVVWKKKICPNLKS